MPNITYWISLYIPVDTMYIKFYNALGLVDPLAGRGQSSMLGTRAGRHLPKPPPGPDSINPNLSSSRTYSAMLGSALLVSTPLGSAQCLFPILQAPFFSEARPFCFIILGPALPNFMGRRASLWKPVVLSSHGGQLQDQWYLLIFSPLFKWNRVWSGRELHDVWLTWDPK